MPQVSFRQMKDGTREDYVLLDELEEAFNQGLVDRLMQALRNLENTLSGYQVSRLEHSLQTAARAEADGVDDDMIVGALLAIWATNWHLTTIRSWRHRSSAPTCARR